MSPPKLTKKGVRTREEPVTTKSEVKPKLNPKTRSKAALNTKSKATSKSTSTATVESVPHTEAKTTLKTQLDTKSNSEPESEEEVPASNATYVYVWPEEGPSQKNVYQFKITLLGPRPSIWRRILVPETYNFFELNWAIKDAMEWEGYHGHEFNIIDKETEEMVKVCSPLFIFDEDDEDNKSIIEKDAKISTYFTNPGDRGNYTYDFGIGWEHEIEFEKCIPANPETSYPKCIEGERACPPEDCGGVGGFAHFLEVIVNPKHEDYQEVKKFLENNYEDYDPGKFNPNEVIFHDPSTSFEF